MLRIRWSSRTEEDLRRIAEYWANVNPDMLPAAMGAIYRRVEWLADGHHQAGVPVIGLSRDYRWYLERRYGYKIYYRLEQDPPDTISIIALRHGRERPLKLSTLRKHGRKP